MGKNEKRYTAVFEPAGAPGWWTVTVAGVAGCVSQGRSIAQARTRIREALALVLDVDEDAFELRDDLRLPEGLKKRIVTYRKRKEASDREAEAASALSREVVRALLGAGYSTRDAGEALGLSQARVAQLAAR